MRTIIIILLIAITVLINCSTENPVVLPDLPSPVGGLTEISDDSKVVMDGVYKVTEGKSRFGDEVVVKWTGKNLSIFSESCYTILQCGHNDSLIFMQGFWRVPTSDATGLSKLVIASTEGGRNILKGLPSNPIIRGKYGNQDDEPSLDLILEYKRPFSTKVLAKDFYIVGHRGGGRTSDRLPVSENSIEMLAVTENIGSTGVEIDIQLTKDNVPVLYHDRDINIRLTTKGPINGPISDYNYDQLSTFVRLIRGETIPRLEDALNFIVDSTNIRLVWLDIKDANVVGLVVPLQAAAIQRALSKGKTVEILMGVPTDEVLDALKSIPGHNAIPSLCEISVETVRELNSRAWGPRWTLGTQNEQVVAMQAEGRIAICWTIDTPGYIEQFIAEGEFDGMLTNYPSTVSYYHYIHE